MLNTLFPTLNLLDAYLASIFPLIVRVCVWGLISGIAAIGIYALSSNQKAIAALKAETRNLRKQAMNLDLENAAAFEITVRNLKVSFALLGRVIGPTLLSMPPILVLAAWLYTYHGYEVPASGDVAIEVKVVPGDAGKATIHPQSVVGGKGERPTLIPSAVGDRIEVLVNGLIIYAGNPFSPPTPFIGREDAWNMLLASEVGYVAKEGPAEEIHLDFSIKRLFWGLPDWASGWELPFFLAAFTGTLAVKFGFKIE